MGKTNKQTGFINHRRLNVSILYPWHNLRHSSFLEIIRSGCEFRVGWGGGGGGGCVCISLPLSVSLRLMSVSACVWPQTEIAGQRELDRRC